MLLTKESLTELVKSGLVEQKCENTSIDVSSIGLCLFDQITTYDPYEGEPIIPPKKMSTTTKTISKEEGVVLAPGESILACTHEYINMPSDKFGLIQTKGSIARGFISIHMSDGQIDPGYKGRITLEIVNMSRFYYKLIPEMPIASLFIIQTDKPVEAYCGRYQLSGSPTAMR